MVFQLYNYDKYTVPTQKKSCNDPVVKSQVFTSSRQRGEARGLAHGAYRRAAAGRARPPPAFASPARLASQTERSPAAFRAPTPTRGDGLPGVSLTVFSLPRLPADARRLAVRSVAAFTQKFSSSIAPHVTTLLVHGKQVTRRARRLALLAVCGSRASETSFGLRRVDGSFSKSRQCLCH